MALKDRMMKITEKSVGDAQMGLKRPKECMYQVFASKMIGR